ncbi:MAG: hypothetical protein GY716_11080 [bacterium]|nr:hypothetical protein [bacterium]
MRLPPGRTRDELDALRLVALGRIQRCRDCLRYRSLVHLVAGRASAAGRLPAVPRQCHEQICAPLTRRHERRSA